MFCRFTCWSNNENDNNASENGEKNCKSISILTHCGVVGAASPKRLILSSIQSL